MRFPLATLCLLPVWLPDPSAAAPAVTIIIDDLGYGAGPGRRAINLPGPVVCAVLPHTPVGRQIAEQAHASGKEVLLHLPLQAIDAEPAGDSIDIDTTRDGFAGALVRDFAAVPHAVGINNHRGSLLTRHPGHMRWLMEELGTRNMVFVDSYTTHLSVGLRMAVEAGLPATRRDVFLDSDPSPGAIRREFQRLLRLAGERGTAVAIAHPYPATLDFLESELPGLEGRGIRLVGLVDLLRLQSARPTPPLAALLDGAGRIASGAGDR